VGGLKTHLNGTSFQRFETFSGTISPVQPYLNSLVLDSKSVPGLFYDPRECTIGIPPHNEAQAAA